MPKKRIVLILVFLVSTIFSVSWSYAQENYVEGYVIKPNKEKVTGFIDYRNWEKNPSLVNFKTSSNAQKTSFGPQDIIEFGAKDEIYISGIIEVETTDLKTENLNNSSIFRIRTDSAFLQAIFRGEKELYFYQNESGRKNFYIKQNKKLELLRYKKYFKIQGGKKAIIENKKFLGQLYFYLGDCPDLKNKIGNISYKRKNLVKLYEQYYECIANEPSFQKKAEKISTEIGLLLGGTSTSLTFETSEFFDFLENTDYKNSVNLTAGMSFDLIFPRNQGKWSLNNELLYTSYNLEGTYETYLNERFNSITMTEIGFTYLRLNTMFRYKYPIGNTSLFLNGGISNGFVLSETNTRFSEGTVRGFERTIEGEALQARKYEQGYLLGIGLRYNSCSLEIRMERGNGMANSSGISSSTQYNHLLLGYKF